MYLTIRQEQADNYDFAICQREQYNLLHNATSEALSERPVASCKKQIQMHQAAVCYAHATEDSFKQIWYPLKDTPALRWATLHDKSES